MILEVFKHQKFGKKKSFKLPDFYTWFSVRSQNKEGWLKIYIP
jgi:hypothetical protein